MGDLDLLVPRRDLERATALALELGYGSPKPFNIEVDVAVLHHVSMLTKAPFYALELHWSLTDPREPHAADAGELWARAQPFAIATRPALGLSDEDLLLHLCVHASYQHRFEFGLRSLCDLARLLDQRGDQMRWDLVEACMRRCGWTRGASLTLWLAVTMLGAPLPARARALTERFTVDATFARAAAAQLLSDGTPVARGLSAMHDLGTPAARLRHLTKMVFAPRDDLRRHYPQVGLEWWRWWIVYVLRTRDLLRKHSGTAARLWSTGRSPVRAAVDRQQSIRMFLAGER
jgi:hypothetical protein